MRAPHALVVGLVAAHVLGCADPGTKPLTAPAAVSRPTYARVTIIDLTIAPTKPNGRPWDGVGNAISTQDSAELVAALGAANPYVAVAAILERPTMTAIDAPEAKGSATLFLGAAAQPPQSFRGPRDSLRPALRPQPTWVHVPLDGTARIRVEVADEDFQFDDPIGAFEINGHDLETAAQVSNIVQIKVADQSGNTILFAGLSAIVE